MPSIGCCEKFIVCLGSFCIQILNVCDSVLGAAAIFSGLYLSLTNKDVISSDVITRWLPICVTILGGLLLLEAILSSFASMSRGYRFLILVAGYLGLCISIFAFSCGIASIVEKDKLLTYLNTHKSIFHLTDNDIHKITIGYHIIIAILFSICLLQLIRYFLSYYLQSSMNRIDREYDALLLENQHFIEEKELITRMKREGKYDSLKEYYKKKYDSSIQNKV